MSVQYLTNFPQQSPEWFKVRAGRATGSRFGDFLRYDPIIKISLDQTIQPDLAKITAKAAKQRDFVDRLKRHGSIEKQSIDGYSIKELEKKGVKFKIEEIPQCSLSDKLIDYIFELIPEQVYPPGILEGFIGNKYTDRGNELEPFARKRFEADTGIEVEEIPFMVNSRYNNLVGISPDGIINKRTAGVEFKCPMPKTHIKYLHEKVLPPAYRFQVHGSIAVAEYDFWYFMSYNEYFEKFLIKVDRCKFTESVDVALMRFSNLYAELKDKIFKDHFRGEVDPLLLQPETPPQLKETNLKTTLNMPTYLKILGEEIYDFIEQHPNESWNVDDREADPICAFAKETLGEGKYTSGERFVEKDGKRIGEIHQDYTNAITALTSPTEQDILDGIEHPENTTFAKQDILDAIDFELNAY